MLNLYQYNDGLKRISKPYHIDNRFIMFKDSPGWSDGYLADLTGDYQDMMQLEAKTKAVAHKNMMMTNNKKDGPEVKKIIPKGTALVDSIDYDLLTGFLNIKNHQVDTWINPKFLRYFMDHYKNDSIKLVLTEREKPVKVVYGKKLIGLIMPIRKTN